MHIGIPKERRPFEYRVGLPPAGVHLFTKHNHTVYVETGAGGGAGFADNDYAQAGASIVYSQEEVFGRADLVCKFARPLRNELELMQDGSTLAGFLHLAAARQDKIDLLLNKKITALAYEQVEDEDQHRIILSPLSQIGGRLVAQVAARLMQNDHGGRGILLGGVPGVPPAEVVIIGAGVVGSTAADSFARIGAHVTLLDIDLRRLQRVQDRSLYSVVTLLSTPFNVERSCQYADVLVGAVLVPGRRSPVVVSREMVSSMKPRSLIIDMSIDQGGCVETSRPTNHGSPTYEDEGVTHYCVPNMSGVLGRTASYALFLGAYPYLEAIAQSGIEGALKEQPGLECGLATSKGKPLHLSRLGGITEPSE
jgi:alanine dehydrogenase